MSNPDRDRFLNVHMGGPTALGHPDVDGLILDDSWGAKPSEIDAHSLEDMGLSAAEAEDIGAAYLLRATNVAFRGLEFLF